MFHTPGIGQQMAFKLRIDSKLEAKFSTALRPLHIASRIVGLAPFTADYTTSIASLAVTLLLMAVVVLGTAPIVGDSFRQIYHGSSPRAIVPRVTIMLTSCIAVVTSLVVAGLRTSSGVAQMTRSFVTFDVLLGHDAQDYKRVSRFLICKIVLMYMILVPHFLSDILRDPQYFTAIIIRYLQYIIFFTLCLQYLSAVVYLKAKLKIINSRLYPTAKQFETNLRYVKGSRLSRNTHLAACYEIEILRKGYMILFQISRCVNSTFGVQIMALVSFMLPAISRHAFSLISYLLSGGQEGVTTEFYFQAVNLNFLIVNSLTLVALALACQATCEEADVTSLLVQQCLLVDDVGGEVRRELVDFSRQLLSNRLVFTASGVFNVDTTLLLSVAATITTYTVILFSS